MSSVDPSGYNFWIKNPLWSRAKDYQRQAGLIKQVWLDSSGVYGCRKIHDDMRDLGDACGKHRVYRLMRAEGIKAQVG